MSTVNTQYIHNTIRNTYIDSADDGNKNPKYLGDSTLNSVF